MSEEKTHHVTVRLARGYEFAAEFNDVPGAPPILFDEPEPLGTNRAPSAVEVLGAAVGNCLAASLAFCLRKSRIELRDLTVHVTTHVAKNEHGRFRVRAIDVELSPVLGTMDTPKLERCGDLFEDFCIVTASVQRGIPVNVSLRKPADVAA
jgi:uncharacterized OsmC-like protein